MILKLIDKIHCMMMNMNHYFQEPVILAAIQPETKLSVLMDHFNKDNKPQIYNHLYLESNMNRIAD